MDGSLASARTRLRAARGRLGGHDSYRAERLATAQNRSSLNFQTGSYDAPDRNRRRCRHATAYCRAQMTASNWPKAAADPQSTEQRHETQSRQHQRTRGQNRVGAFNLAAMHGVLTPNTRRGKHHPHINTPASPIPSRMPLDRHQRLPPVVAPTRNPATITSTNRLAPPPSQAQLQNSPPRQQHSADRAARPPARSHRSASHVRATAPRFR